MALRPIPPKLDRSYGAVLVRETDMRSILHVLEADARQREPAETISIEIEGHLQASDVADLKEYNDGRIKTLSVRTGHASVYLSGRYASMSVLSHGDEGLNHRTFQGLDDILSRCRLRTVNGLTVKECLQAALFAGCVVLALAVLDQQRPGVQIEPIIWGVAIPFLGGAVGCGYALVRLQLPRVPVDLRRPENLLKRYNTELTLLIGLAALVVAVVA